MLEEILIPVFQSDGRFSAFSSLIHFLVLLLLFFMLVLRKTFYSHQAKNLSHNCSDSRDEGEEDLEHTGLRKKKLCLLITVLILLALFSFILLAVNLIFHLSSSIYVLL